MSTMTLVLDAVLSSANVTSGTATVNNLNAQDANWCTSASTTSDGQVTASFSHPIATVSGAVLTSGAGLQTFTVQARKQGGTGTPTFTIAVLENGVQKAISSAQSVTSTSGQTFTFTWNANLLTDPLGAGVEIKVTSTASGGSPGARASVDFGYLAWTADYTVDSTPPTITSSATFNVNEGAAFNQTLTANESVTWTKIGGGDQALFTLTSGGALSMAAKDFEAPADSDANNVYVVQVRATDLVGNTTDQTISVTVVDVAAVTITSGTSFTSTEITGSSAGLTLTASATSTWSIVGGADQAHFIIYGGNVLNLQPQDFEDPSDANADNVYEVVIRATPTGGGDTADQTITCTVQDTASEAKIHLRNFFLSSTTAGSIASSATLLLSSSSTLQLNFPPNYRVDDMMFLEVVTANKNVTTPSGWTLLFNTPGFGTVDGSDGLKVYLFYRRMTGSETSPVSVTVSSGTTQNNRMALWAYLGVKKTGTTVELVGTQEFTTAAASFSINGTTTAQNYTRMGCIFAAQNSGTGFGTFNPSGSSFTESVSLSQGNCSSHQKTVAGVIGNVTVNMTGGFTTTAVGATFTMLSEFVDPATGAPRSFGYIIG